MCEWCDKYLGKELKVKDIPELKKASHIVIDFIECKEGSRYRCYCDKCGRTKLVYV